MVSGSGNQGMANEIKRLLWSKGVVFGQNNIACKTSHLKGIIVIR